MNEEALLALIAQWESRAAEAREQTRLIHASDVSRAAYYEGVLRTYLGVANDLRALLSPATSAETPTPAPHYLAVPESEAADLLRRAGLFARSLTLHPDGVFSAVFSRLQPVTLENRVAQLSAADPRIVIVDSGTLRDTGDPYIDFAFTNA